MDLGANVVPEGVSFRLWAPAAKRVDVVGINAGFELPMQHSDDDTWHARVDVKPGFQYRYRLDGGEAYPDPYSRFQPEGVHGPSEVMDTASFEWHDADWPGLDPAELVIYELHVGTFTPEGKFEGVIGKLPYLKSLGISAIELMPVAEFSGRRNWGYDGVDWFAPSRSYGGPPGLQRLVDAAHHHGLGVLLDVVLNHFGPEGNYLRRFSPDYFTQRHRTPWGEAINYDGPNNHWVRKLAVDLATYWLREYHVDGYRLDATFAVLDSSPVHILREVADAVRQTKPSAMLIAETHENDVRYLRPPEEGGYGFDAVWADDFHHALRRRLAGDSEEYFGDYAGTLDELARTINQGFLYEGQRSTRTGLNRGTQARDRPARQFVYCIQNHDQVGNRALGDRLNHDVGAGAYRLASVLLLTVPYTPLLFMGQEFAASSPFQYFTDHSPELGKLVTEGRRREFEGFTRFSDIPDPQAQGTFLASKLNWEEARNPLLRLYQECLRLRREDPVLRLHDRFRIAAAALSPDILTVRFGVERLLVANFGGLTELTWSKLAFGPNAALELNSDDSIYGGSGQSVQLNAARLTVPAHSALLLASSGKRLASND